MTLVDPILSSQAAVPDLGSFGYVRFPDAQPFSQRTASGYQETLEEIVHWLQSKLVPYLISTNPQGVWDSNVIALIAAVDSALTAQTTANAQAIANALTAIANADIPITDPVILAVFQSAQTSTRQWLDQRYQLAGIVAVAPAPKGNGQDDTAALMAAIAPLHTAGATLLLQRGLYVANLVLAPQFAQLKIIGTGEWGTVIKAATKTLPAVQFNGGSGQFGGGGLFECGLVSADGANREGIALAFCGTTGCTAKNVRISGSFGEAVRWWNSRQGDFTEFCTFEGDISGANAPFVYQVDNGVESFHGSGPTGNTTVNVPADKVGPIVYCQGIAFPYNAPLSFTVWFQNAAQFLINYANPNPNRHASFYGTVRMEGHPAGNEVELVQSAGAEVYLIGGIIGLGVGNELMGKLYLCKKVSYEGGTVVAEKLPYSTRANLKASPTIIALAYDTSAIHLVAVTIVGPNYHRTTLLAVWSSPYDTGGTVTEVARVKSIDNANVGDPVFTVSQGALFVSSPNFTASFYANVTVQNAGGSYVQLLAQRRFT